MRQCKYAANKLKSFKNNANSCINTNIEKYYLRMNLEINLGQIYDTTQILVH